MFHNKRYKEIGISDKDWFTDQEFKQLPDISLLYDLYKDYKSQLNHKQSIENQITQAQERNQDLPDNTDQIQEKEQFITQIEQEYDSETILNKQKLDQLKEQALQEIEELTNQQAPTDIQPLNDSLVLQEQDLTSKIQDLNEESKILGLGDLV